jgi:hypothetical protein
MLNKIGQDRSGTDVRVGVGQIAWRDSQWLIDAIPPRCERGCADGLLQLLYLNYIEILK